MKRFLAAFFMTILVFASPLFSSPWDGGTNSSDTLHLVAYKDAPLSAVLDFEFVVSNKKTSGSEIEWFTNNSSYEMEENDFENGKVFDNAITVMVGMNSRNSISVELQLSPLRTIDSNARISILPVIWRFVSPDSNLDWVDEYESNGSVEGHQTGQMYPFKDGSNNYYKYRLKVTASTPTVSISSNADAVVNLEFTPESQRHNGDENWDSVPIGSLPGEGVLPGFYSDCEAMIRGSAVFSLELYDLTYNQVQGNIRYFCTVKVSVEGN